MIGPPVVETVDGVVVVRDDLVPGGTKARVIPLLFGDADEYVYASPVQGYAQVALAYAAREHGKRATIFCARRGRRHPRTVEAAAAGAAIHEVGPAGYLTVVKCRAREYCGRTGAVLLPFGLDLDVVRVGIADAALSIGYVPDEVWTVAGSGTLTRALQLAWPGASFNAVQIGAVPDVGGARLWRAPEKFEDDAEEPPPFASCTNYDAKAWRFVRRHAGPGALFWNVAR